MREVASQRQKTLRAFLVYVEIMDTAAWLHGWMHGPLRLFDLTPQGFRLLILLYENGPTRMMEAARRMRIPRANLDPIMRRLEARGWVRRVMVNLPAGRKEGPKRPGERYVRPPRRRWGVGVLELTPEGEKFVARVFPNHAKVVKALMRALHGREQQTLVEICRKLRTGAILKFISEITHMDDWETTSEGTVEAGGGRAEEARSKLLRPSPEDADETLDAMSARDWELVEGIAEKMRRYNVLKGARNVDWNKPPDEKREAKNAVAMLSRLGNDKERKLLERLERRMSCVEIVRMMQRAEVGG
jgi:DNA-binding MarR family transcriptional regulator